MSIQKKVVIAILVAGLSLLATSLFVTYFQVKTVLIEERGEDFTSIARKIAERVDTTVKDEITTFQYLTENQAFLRGVKENNGEAIEVYLTYYLSYVEEREKHLDLFVVNEKGKIIAAGNLRSSRGTDYSHETWWKMISGGKVYMSNIYLDQMTGNRALIIGIPILDPETGRVVGAVGNVVNVDVFFNFWEMNFGRTGHSMLVDSEGTPLVCSLLPLSEHLMNKPLIDLIIRRGDGWAIVEDDAHGGRNSLVGFSPVEYIT